MPKVAYAFLLFLFSFSAASIAMPFVIRLAKRFHVMDIPSYRKSHERAIPSMGGLAIFFAFFVTVLIHLAAFPLVYPGQQVFHGHIFNFLLCSVPLVIVGILDDRYRVNYKIKFLIQIATALLMIGLGYQIYGITNPINGETILLGYYSIPVTVFWFLFIINAINFIDGIDGLAGGVSLIAVATIFLISLYLNNGEVAIVSAILAGSIVGFLRYNFHPASIFMGDTGSLFLGYMLATLSLQSSQKSSTVVAIVIPIAVLGLPILDAVLAVSRRLFSGLVGQGSFQEKLFAWKKIFIGDKQHIHHQLLATGISKKQVVVFLYLVALGFGMIGFVLTAARYQYIALILLYMGIILFIAFRKLTVIRPGFSSSEIKQAVSTEHLMDVALQPNDSEVGILVIEPKKNLSREVLWLATHSSIHVTHVCDAIEALQAIQTHDYSIAILDYDFKKENTPAFCNQLKRKNGLMQFLILAHAHEFVEIAKKMDSFIFDIIEKPPNPYL
ncbi:MAG: hypothetical protein HY586_06960, partial [Candidatus Omnitrophica bacterium]|nr:hypothetical protein [Candidatus Omnitrophota bacterium]